MKIVTYNVNGLRQRISQFGSLSKLLNSFDADIICFQETKLRRQELTSDVVIAEGYESFFSCTRTSDKGRTGYSGVATFCRVKSAFSSSEVALPVSAEEGITGLLNNKNETPVTEVKGLEEFSKDVLLHIDNEGRCMITDHGHFVIFNLYGPRADPDDTERIQFKLNFFSILQKRWEYLLKLGRRIVVVGDLNIAPAAIDRCDAPPDFENNEFRRWLRSLLVENGGPFFDVFRVKHPERRDAFTCWPSNTGAEQFNFGSRIDHILSAGSCLHQLPDLQGHDFFTCHVKECDILTEYKRWKPGNTLRWKGGWNTKLEGSDHAPVYTRLVGIPDVPQHDTPSSSSRYYPMIHGVQQSLVSMLVKRQVREQAEIGELSTSFSDEKNVISMKVCTGSLRRSYSCEASGSTSGEVCASNQESGSVNVHGDIYSTNFACEVAYQSTSQTQPCKTKKKSRKTQKTQLSLRSFFSTSESRTNVENPSSKILPSQANAEHSDKHLDGDPVVDEEGQNAWEHGLTANPLSQQSDESKQDEFNTGSSSQKVSNSAAVLEWRRIQQVMQNSIPLCKGHREPCVSRIVKKAGPNFGRRFYSCARAEGPSSNPEANCGFFKWASSKTKQRQ